MPGKITELAALTGATAATTDLVEVVDTSDTTMASSGTNKKLPLSEMIAFLNANGITVANGSVTNAKLANMAGATVKGRYRDTGSGPPVDLDAYSLGDILNTTVFYRPPYAISAFSSSAHVPLALDAGALFEYTGTDQTVTINAQATTAWAWGAVLHGTVRTSQVTIVPAAGVTIRSADGALTAPPGSWWQLTNLSTDNWYLAVTRGNQQAVETAAYPYTVVAADAGKLRRVTAATTFTLPSAGPAVGQRVDYLCVGGIASFVLGAGATWDALPVSTSARAIGSLVTVIKTGATTWALVGDLAAAAHSPAVKTAIWPGDVFPVDSAMPAFATTADDFTRQLGRLGYAPDPAYENVWIDGQNFIVGGQVFYWSGTNWAVGVAPYKTTLAPMPSEIYSSSGATIQTADFSRMSKAKRLTHLSRRYTALPATAWGENQFARFHPNHAVRWTGTAWEFAAQAPEFSGHPFSKVLTFGSFVNSDTSITAANAANANSLTGLGFTPGASFRPLNTQWGGVSFASAGDKYGNFAFHWNGTAWTSTSPSANYLWLGTTTVNDTIAAIADPQEKLWAINTAYPAAGNDDWSPTTSCTVAGVQVYRGPDTWLYGASPGTAPPVPDPTALMPGDQFIAPFAGIGPYPSPQFYQGSVVSRINGAGWRPHSSERSTVWRTATKMVKYLNVNLWWTGTHFSELTPPNSTPQSIDYRYHYPTVYTVGGAFPVPGRLATVAEQETLALSAYSHPPSNGPAAWTGDTSFYDANVIYQWNGTAYKVVGKTPRIIEAAAYPCVQGDVFTDDRITAAGDIVNLVGWGYIPVLRTSWKGYNNQSLPIVPSCSWSNSAGVGITAYWTGTAWAANQSNLAYVTVNPGDTVADTAISALPADEKVVACTMCGYAGGATAWTTGQSATIGGAVVHWYGPQSRRYWMPGAAP